MSTIQVFQPTEILSAVNSNALTHWVSAALQSGARILLIDLQHVEFMDSGGLGGLVLALKQVRRSGGRMAICALNDQLQMLLKLTDMEEVFEIYANQAEFEQTVQATLS